MQKLNISFGKPEHGWMEIVISSPSTKIVSNVSDVPCDSLYGLVKALLRLVEGSNEELVEWSLEPEYMGWIFKQYGNDIEFTVKNPSDLLPTFVYLSEASKLIHCFYNSLRDLEVNQIWQQPDTADRIWSWEFPSSLLATLKQKIG
jgi:hypothetical protein